MKNLKFKFKENKVYNPLFLDVETQYLSDEVQGGWNAIDKFKVSIAVSYDNQNEFRVWQEEDSARLIDECSKFFPIVTFNGERFDFIVLSAYGDVSRIYNDSCDLLKILQHLLGHRVMLDSIAKATIGAIKTADGVKAVEWWRSGDPELRQKVIDYCKEDVRILRDVYNFAKEKGYLLYTSFKGIKRVNVIV